MIWQRASCEKEINCVQGPEGVLVLGDALAMNLSPYEGQAQCVYADPPYFTGDRFEHKLRIGREGWTTGRRMLTLPAYDDFSGASRETYLAFLKKLVQTAHRLLRPDGSFFLHVDCRASAHARLLCDEVFGEDNFVNEIVWHYQTGGRSKKYFSRKHDTILFYGRSAERFFDITKVPAGRKKNHANHMKRQVDERGRSYRSIVSGGKTYIYYDDEPAYPDDVWSDVSQMQQKDPQRTGYATQKPLALLNRIIRCSTRPGDLVADLMCGSGTALVAAAQNGRRFLGIDSGICAFSVARKRLTGAAVQAIAPLSAASAMVDAGVMPGIGFYDVDLNAYILPTSAFDGMTITGGPISGLDVVDQWYAGLLVGDEFRVYASAVRDKTTPELQRMLKVPLLRGTVGILIVDVLGNRSLWTPTAQI